MTVLAFRSGQTHAGTRGYGLTTAKIIYRLPDDPARFQTYVWQAYDEAPRFPGLAKFLAFWRANLDGPLHHVTVSHAGLVTPIELDAIGAGLRLQ